VLEKPGRKRVLWGVLLFLAISLGVSAVWGWLWFQNNKQTLIFIGRGHLRNVRLLAWDPSRRVSFQVGGLRIEGSLYSGRGSTRGPALVLLHGSSRPARKEALIQVLARKFYERGYAVLTFDFQGYGESEDPSDHHQAGAFDFVQDTHKALDFLLAQPGIDPERLYFLGHSLGAGVALALQSEDSRVKKMVLVGPPRRLKAQFLQAGDSDQRRWLSEWEADMKRSTPLNLQLKLDSYRRFDIEEYIPQFQKPGHLPLFIIQSGREDPEDQAFLEKVVAQMTPEVHYWNIPRTDHYLNTRLIGRLPFYNMQIMDPFVQRVDQWLREPR